MNPMAGSPRSLILSGIQPTGELMIGNYVGALKNWVELQATHESFFLLADLHAITVPQNPTWSSRAASPVNSTVFTARFSGSRNPLRLEREPG